ncbi:hypothetical protein Scep_019946 [Stephania cephalantha]|uniref:Pentatricopeptide repeat-containing protein n=1 Tax=Stephania cephalantha TaxID=152367 RepID=A0AAP0IC91_9MAGN
MPTINSPLKLKNSSLTQLRFFLRFHSIPISPSSVPTPQQIAHLILEQKSPSQALQTFRWASKIHSFTHNQSTYRALIHKLCAFRRFKTVNEVLDEMPSSIGSPPDEAIFVTIVRGLGRAGLNREAIKVIDLVRRFREDPSLKIFNSVLDVLVKEDINLARKFYRGEMMGCGIKGDEYTFGILMKGLCLTNRIGDGFKLLQLMKSYGVSPNTVIYNTLIHALCKNGKVGRGRSLMSEMDSPNEVTFNILISRYCQEGHLVQALVLLEKCFNLGFFPDVVTLTKVVGLLCDNGRVTDAVEVLERVGEKGGAVDAVTYNTLIKGFCRLGKAKVARRYLREMERNGCLPNVITYNALISGFCECGGLDSAVDLVEEMKMVGINPNCDTYNTVIAGFCSRGRVEDGLKMLELMEENRGLGSQIAPYNNIIYGLYRENRFDEAVAFLAKMGSIFPRAVDRSLSILRFCEEGVYAEAKKVYQLMIKEGGRPSALVYATLINALCEEGDVREAFEMLNDMVNHNYFPTASTFNILIDGLCKQGKVGSASKLIEEMVGKDCSPDIGSFNPLTNAFCEKGDFGRAVGVLMKMLEHNVLPDYFTWKSLLLCLSQEKLWLDRKHLLQLNSLLC